MSNRPGILQVIRNSFWNPQAEVRRSSYEDFVLKGGGFYSTSSGGEGVTEDRGSKISTVFSCVNLIAQDIAKLPFSVHQDSDEGKKIVKAHPTNKIIHKRPNYKMTAYSFWYSQVWTYLTWGNAYSIILRDGNGMPSQLLPLIPYNVRLIDNGEIYAEVKDVGTFAYRDIFHLKMFTSDGLNGISPIIHNSEIIGKKIKETKYAAKNLGSAPSLYLSGEANPEQQKSIVEAWRGSITSAGDQIRVPFLTGDIRVNKLSIPPNELQYIETTIQTNKEIYGIYRVNPTMVSNFDQGVQSNAEQQDINHLKHTLTPHIEMIEQECNWKLFTPSNEIKASPYYTKHNVNGILRGDTSARQTFYQTMKDGIMTPNEIREKEDLGPLDGGDQLFMQGAMMPINKLGEDGV